MARVEQSELEQLTRSLAERVRLRGKTPARPQATPTDPKQLAESASRAQPAAVKPANEFGQIAAALEEGDLLLNVVAAAGCYQLSKVTPMS